MPLKNLANQPFYCDIYSGDNSAFIISLIVAFNLLHVPDAQFCHVPVPS